MTPRSRCSVAEGASTLVIHPGALGDVLLAIPALRALRQARPGEALVLAAQPRIGALLRALGEVDAALDVDSLGLHALFVEDGITPPSLTAWAHVVSWFGAHDATFGRRLTALVPHGVVSSSTTGAAPVWEHLVLTVGGDPRGRRGAVTVSPALRHQGRRALAQAGWNGTAPCLIVHPGTASPSKRWPSDGFAAALAGIVTVPDVFIVLHEGPADADAVEGLRRRWPAHAAVLEGPALPVLAGALARATAYVGNDSGVSHLAAAIGVPSVLVVTAALRRWRPWHAATRCVEVSTDQVRESDVRAVRAVVETLPGVGSPRQA